MPSIRLTNLTADDGWTCLGGPCIKAANIRAIVPWFEQLAATYFLCIDDESRCLRIVTSQLNRMYEILYSRELFLTTAQKTEFALANLSFGKHIMLLREFAASRMELRFQLTPKVHYHQHLPVECALINSMFTQNYAHEGAVGRLVRIWKGSIAGKYRAYVQRNVLLKFVCALLIRLGILG